MSDTGGQKTAFSESVDDSTQRDRHRYLFTIKVYRIVVQPDKYKPVSLKPVELEVLRLKRALVDVEVRNGQRESKLSAVIEFRGHALTLSRSEGDCNVDEVGRRLGIEYHRRYGKEGLRLIDNIFEGRRVCEYTVADPARFLDFLHLVKNRKGLDVYEGEAETVDFNTRLGVYPRKVIKEFQIQLSDRVYTPLLREVGTWEDPMRARFSEWTRLEQEERLWVRNVPEDIAKLLHEAKISFERIEKLRVALNELISEATGSYAKNWASKLGPDRVDDIGSVEYRFVREPGGFVQGIHVSWLWELETSLSNYLADIIQLHPTPKAKWKLETWVYPRTGGAGIQVGGHWETRELIDRILRFLMSQEMARELREKNAKVKDLGKRILTRIDEELDKFIRGPVSPIG